MIDAACPHCCAGFVEVGNPVALVACLVCNGDSRKPVGDEEGEQCGRDGCEGILKIEPRADTNGCSCHLGGAPCSHCMSYAPECPHGCYRGEECDG